MRQGRTTLADKLGSAAYRPDQVADSRSIGHRLADRIVALVGDAVREGLNLRDAAPVVRG